MLYVYGLSDKSENAGIRGLKFHLAVEQDGYSMDAYKIHPETPKWIDYSTRLRQIVKDYNNIGFISYCYNFNSLWLVLLHSL